MDVIERREDPTRNNSNNESRQSFKFQQRKINIGKVIWSKKTPHQSIMGYKTFQNTTKRGNFKLRDVGHVDLLTT